MIFFLLAYSVIFIKYWELLVCLLICLVTQIISLLIIYNCVTVCQKM